MKKISICIFVLTLLALSAGCSTPLITAVPGGDVNKVAGIIKAGADVNETDSRGFTPLMQAAVNGRIEVVRLLVDNGADVNKGTKLFGTPLLLAAQYGRTEIVKLLLDRGADMYIAKFGNDTPLSWAAHHGNAETVRILLDRGADAEYAIALLKRSTNRKDNAGAALIERIMEERNKSAVAEIRPKVMEEGSGVSAITSDVDMLPVVEARQRKNFYAIVIGIEEYREKLPMAEFAAADARLVAEYLKKVLGYPAENVVVLVNDKASRNDMEKYFHSWLANNVEKDSEVFIYFSGHGAPDPAGGEAFIVPYDGDPTYIKTTGYPLDHLYATLGKLPSKEILVILDSCFSGAGGRSVIAKGLRPLVMTAVNQQAIQANTTILSASSGDQVSSTYLEKGHGLFTYFVLKGLKEKAGTSQDGRINVETLYHYAKENVERIARKIYNNEQSPQLWMGGMKRGAEK